MGGMLSVSLAALHGEQLGKVRSLPWRAGLVCAAAWLAERHGALQLHELLAATPHPVVCLPALCLPSLLPACRRL